MTGLVKKETTSSLATPNRLRNALATAQTPTEARGIEEQANRLRDAMVIAGRSVAEANEYAQIAVEAAVAVGEMLNPNVKRGRPQKNSTRGGNFSSQAASKYRALAKVPEDEREQYYERARAEEEVISKRGVLSAFKEKEAAEKKAERIEVIERQAEEIAAATPEAPAGLFHVISIDPPWPYSDRGDPGKDYDPNGRRAANPYPEMSLEEIEGLYIPAADDCVLWLWTTHKFMRHSFTLLDTWGFRDVAILTWVKDRMGLGSWLRSQSEFCIMAVKGSPPISLTNQTTVINGPLREHSRKPDQFYELVESLCHGRKLDFFSREPREGWEQFGNDPQKFNAPLP